jgi:D-methionine transport system substrate-binding protein
MKKIIKAIFTTLFALTLTFSAVSCNKNKENTIVVGASSTPHALILEEVKDDLAAQGYTLEIRIMDDYVTPNTALENGDIDANYFQHTPYLDDFNKENNTHLSSVAKIHYEPFGVYGNNVTQASFDTEKTGRTILIPSDGSNCTRALFVLKAEGYIELNDGVTAFSSLTVQDVKNSNGNTLVPVEAAQLPAQLKNSDSGSIAVINGNYAIAANLKISEALATESASGEAAQLYANIIAVKNGNEESAKIKALVAALKTEKVYNFIQNTFDGAVQPAFAL